MLHVSPWSIRQLVSPRATRTPPGGDSRTPAGPGSNHALRALAARAQAAARHLGLGILALVGYALTKHALVACGLSGDGAALALLALAVAVALVGPARVARAGRRLARRLGATLEDRWAVDARGILTWARGEASRASLVPGTGAGVRARARRAAVGTRVHLAPGTPPAGAVVTSGPGSLIATQGGR